MRKMISYLNVSTVVHEYKYSLEEVDVGDSVEEECVVAVAFILREIIKSN